MNPESFQSVMDVSHIRGGNVYYMPAKYMPAGRDVEVDFGNVTKLESAQRWHDLIRKEHRNQEDEVEREKVKATQERSEASSPSSTYGREDQEPGRPAGGNRATKLAPSEIEAVLEENIRASTEELERLEWERKTVEGSIRVTRDNLDYYTMLLDAAKKNKKNGDPSKSKEDGPTSEVR